MFLHANARTLFILSNVIINNNYIFFNYNYKTIELVGFLFLFKYNINRFII